MRAGAGPDGTACERVVEAVQGNLEPILTRLAERLGSCPPTGVTLP
ncbi:MAG: hypothetical protein AVDCRST_MAG61-2760 [uncultured Friedmanniella sp.]|uniref:Uncharacterized protein n=1 Tax=uncultured Friedmanniella sp. TaxID=335381 RepID=A0A6J4LC06_9ACTN|nr:hypothetical protein [uncultured Friedmanniella sp.]CAA9329445.1 MAG: hypothetical protein AVDCRST_MAG61-2760 [uncultured Friedmanniella sp.]